MYQASEQFNAVILGNERTFRAKIKTGDTEITSGIISIKQYAQSASDTITVGGAMSAYVEIQMWKPDVQLEGNEVEISIGLIVDGALEYVPLGLFTVQKPEDDDGVISFTGYDRIQSKMGGAYFSELTYPADGKSVLAEISSKTGVPIDTSSLPDGIMISQRAVVSEAGVDDDGNETTSTTYTNPFDGYTYREALGYIAMLYCKFATVDRAGTVVFRWYADASYTVGPNRYYDDLVTAETVFSVGAISCSVGDTVLTAGSGTETIQLENPVMTQERLDAIYESIKSLQFLPAGLSFYGDLKPELGDIVAVNDKYGNIVCIPVMSITQEFDGGLLTKIQSFGGTEQESSDTKGPTAKKMDRVYTDLFLVKELIGSKADFDYVHGKVGEFETMKATVAEINSAYISMAQVNTLLANYATIDLANITAGSIKTAMIDIGAVNTAQIADGAITDAKIVNLTANKIDAGTLSVERLEIRGSTNSIVYAINNITGALQAQNVDTLNGEILTPRSITADRIVANSITGNEIAAKTITANNIVANSITGDEIAAGSIKAVNIDVTNLFAQDITATGKIRGVELIGATGSFTGNVTANTLTCSSGTFGGWNISSSGISKVTGTKGVYVLNGTDSNNNYLVVNEFNSDGSWKSTPFYVRSTGQMYAANATIKGNITATSGKIGSFNINSSLYTNSNALIYTGSSGNVYLGSDGVGFGRSYLSSGGGAAFIGYDGTNSSVEGNRIQLWAKTDTSDNPAIELFGGGGNNGSSYAMFRGPITTYSNLYFQSHGLGFESKTSWGICGIKTLSTGATLNLFAQKTGSSGWTDAISLIGSDGTIQIPTKTGEGASGTWGINITGYIKDYSGHTRMPASSAETDGARVSYIASKLRTSDTKYYVTIQGQYGTTGSTYNAYNYLSTSSDARLKENIKDSNISALDTINEIKIRQFDYRQTGNHQKIGVVADELELIDTAFTFGGGYTEDGSMNIKSVDTFYMMGYVVKGIQEICTIDAEQNIRLAELDRKYLSHEAQIESLQQQLIDARQQIAEQASEIAQLRSMISAA